ncbi:MAG: hypothetical protein J6A47_09490 [Bacilli bacterium]|nr:hypothetical protein [Bacilli bacterium]MBO6284784.1 hypothetical protein [Bacilli bacterium]
MKKLNLFRLLLCTLSAPVVLASCGMNAQNAKTIESVVTVNVPDAPILVGEFDNAGIQIVITYTDGTTDVVPLTQDMCPQIYQKYFNEAGTFVVSFLYRGFQVTFEVTMYVANTWSVRFFNAVNDCVKEVVMSELSEGTPIPPTAEEMYVEGYIWTGEWDKDFEHATSDLDVFGIYEKTYTVDFYNGLNTLISHQVVKEGDDATAPTGNVIQVPGYDFIGWDTTFTNIQKDTVVYGIYSNVYAPNHQSIWDGSIATTYDGGIGTKDDPYRIGSASQFAKMAKDASAYYYVLTCDLDMMGLPWQPYDLRASLEGAGHTVSNISVTTNAVYAGIFKQVKSDVAFKNINFKGITINATNPSEAGGLFAWGVASGNYCTLDLMNITISGTINVQTTGGTCNVGALAGILQGSTSSSYKTTVTNIITDVDINVTHLGESSAAVGLGGLAGCTSGYAYPLKNCLSVGDITASGFSSHSIGRIVPTNESKNSGFYYNQEQTFQTGSSAFIDVATGVSVSDLNSASFYTETMGLDASAWKLDNLDVSKKNIARVKVFNPLPKI